MYTCVRISYLRYATHPTVYTLFSPVCTYVTHATHLVVHVSMYPLMSLMRVHVHPTCVRKSTFRYATHPVVHVPSECIVVVLACVTHIPSYPECRYRTTTCSTVYTLVLPCIHVCTHSGYPTRWSFWVAVQITMYHHQHGCCTHHDTSRVTIVIQYTRYPGTPR